MKKTSLAFLALLFVVLSCSKSSTTPEVVYKFMSITAGSTWQYRTVNNITTTTTNYTLTSTNRDSVINSKSYHVFTNSTAGNSEYYLITGNDYYTFRNLGLTLGNTQIEDLYLKDNSAVGTSWSESINLSVPINPPPFPPLVVPIVITYTIMEKGVSRTVNSIAYTDVIHVQGKITSSLIPAASLTTDIQNYYARKFGMIETNNKLNLNFMGIVQSTDNKTILLSSDIK